MTLEQDGSYMVTYLDPAGKRKNGRFDIRVDDGAVACFPAGGEVAVMVIPMHRVLLVSYIHPANR